MRLIRKRLELSWLTFDRQHSDGERLLHQMQIASSKLGHAVTSRKKIEQLRTAPAKKHNHIFAAMRWRLQLYCTCAAVVVEVRPSELYLAETTAMIIVGLALSLFAVGILCWLLFTLAVYATPFLIGVTGALPDVFGEVWQTTITRSRRSACGGESGFTGNNSVLFLRCGFHLLF